MAVKAIQAKVTGPPAALDHLRLTHDVFNDLVKYLIGVLFEMRTGRRGPDMKALYELIFPGGKGTSQKSFKFLEPVTAAVWTPAKPEEWHAVVKRIRKDGGLLFDRHRCFCKVAGVTYAIQGKRKADLPAGTVIIPSGFWRKVCEMAVQSVSANAELHKRWRTERDEWRKEKAKWEAEHPEFMKAWPEFVTFEKECERRRKEFVAVKGQKIHEKKAGSKRARGKRWSRWPLYVEWLEASGPELVRWRGKAEATGFIPVTDEEKAGLEEKHRKQEKLIKAVQSLLLEKNPELAELDRLRRVYFRDYCRFKRPPTFTYPSADKHPANLQFQKGKGYQITKLDLNSGRVTLSVLMQQESGQLIAENVEYLFRPDPRLTTEGRGKRFASDGTLPPIRNTEIAGQAGPALRKRAEEGKPRIAVVSGIKLLYRRKKPYFVFTVHEQDMPRRIHYLKKTEYEKDAPWADRRVSTTKKNAVRALAVDLGLRHLAVACVCDGKKHRGTWKMTVLRKQFLDSPGATLRSVIDDKYKLRRKRRRRGKPVAGEESEIQLQAHATNAARDRFKQGAAAIVKLAREYDVDIIVSESLSRFTTTAENERWVNRQHILWNKRNLQEWIEQKAAEFGIDFLTVNPYATSRMCASCGYPGFRYSVRRKRPRREQSPRSECVDYGYPVWDMGGHLFVCPHCGHRIHADLNAAENIAHVFLGTLNPPDSLKNNIAKWTDPETGQTKTMDLKGEFKTWAAPIKAETERAHRQKAAEQMQKELEDQSPF